MKILIISGFLGAGKTTFIKALAKHTGKEFAILENEYGAKGIDGERLAAEGTASKDDIVNIWEMTEGCICCSAKGDFAASVLTIANALDPEYLVVEPTGVGMLGNIIDNLRQIEYEHISVLSPVTIVDMYGWKKSFKEYPSLFENQVSSAGSLFVSKSEQTDISEKNEIRDFLYTLNKEASIYTEHYSLLPKEKWMKLLYTKYDGSIEQLPDDNEILPDSFSISDTYVNSPEEMIIFLEDLIRGKYGHIIRAKGQIKAGDQDLMFDTANERYCITGAENIATGKAVFIGNDIARQKIRRLFHRKFLRTGVSTKKYK